LSKIELMQKNINVASINGVMANLQNLKNQVDGLLVELEKKQRQFADNKIDKQKEAVAPESVSAPQVEKPVAKSSDAANVSAGRVVQPTVQSPLNNRVQRPSDANTRTFDQRSPRQQFNKDGSNIRSRTFNDSNFPTNRYNNADKPNRPQGRPGVPGQNYRQPYNNANGQKMPYNPNAPRPQGARLNQRNTPRPESVEKFDASIVQKNTRVFTNKKKTKNENYDERQGINKKALIMRGYETDESLIDEDGGRRYKTKTAKKEQKAAIVVPKIEKAVITTDNLTVKMLAEKIGKPVPEIMSKFLLLGMMVNINSNIDFDSAELIAGELGVKLEKNIEKSYEEKLSDIYNVDADDEKDLVKRPPVVTVLGHVDHGKTSLLDYIRKTNVTAGEAGGITQRIGAYTIEVNKETVTFIDTPGHEAFSAMRKRGASLTDIAILIVAADDGVKPQTVEAIKYIKEAKVPYIVAVNKMDKPEADLERVKTDLANNDVLIEEWGGDAILVPISAKTGMGIDKLLEMILFVADYQNLRANPKAKARGAVVEAELDKGRGPVATILVQNGTLKVGDNVICGNFGGKIRAMLNEKGKNVRTAGPSMAVSVLGLSGVPSAGDEMFTVDEKMSKKVLSERKVKEQTSKIKAADVSVDSLLNRIKENELKDYNIIIKADVQGSLEALKHVLSPLRNEEVKVNCIHGGVGIVNENDVMLANASNALIVAFDVKTDFKAQILSEKYHVQIKNYSIIYEVLDYVTEAIEKMKTPKYEEVVTGHAEIRALFKSSKTGLIAGSYILDGKITKQEKFKLLRKGKLIAEGNIVSIQREKTEVKDISSGFECGILLDNNADIQIGDIIESIKMQRI